MKAYKVSFDYNGVNGMGHTWIDANSADDAMRTVRTLTGYAVVSAEPMTDDQLAIKISNSTMPAKLRYWYSQFKQEGENPRAAIKHAIDRCYESGVLSERLVDKYEAMFYVA